MLYCILICIILYIVLLYIILYYAGNLFLNEDCSDIILVVGGQKFPAHKVILASRCDYFR